ncbi:MAG: hypothetical protein CMF55_01585 [Legionellales bacterium]|nr:hypothetical protein [Legionellales bacterium]HAG62239.1 hypothetical protein [Coxiellaceae bacterium]
MPKHNSSSTQCPIQNILRHINDPQVMLPTVFCSLAVLYAVNPSVCNSVGAGVSDLFQAIGEGLDDAFMDGFSHYINLGAYL